MTRHLIALLAASVSAPALAQHAGHAAPPPPPAEEAQEQSAAPDPHAGHAVPAPAPPPPPAQPEDPHAGHSMPTPTPAPPPQPADPHAGHATPPTPPQPADPHAGHAMPPATPAPPPPTAGPHAGHAMPPAQQPADPHAGHQMGTGPDAPSPPVAPPPPEALSGPTNAADSVYGTGPMAHAREALHETHGDLRSYKVMADQLEVRIQNGADGFAWEDVQLWYGGDIDKLWIKSEGEGAFGEGLEQGDVQALWVRAIDPWFDLQAGVRLNFGRGPERPHLVLGLQGLAPYWFEIDAAAFLSSDGDLTAQIEAEYDQRITQRLILQPRIEAEFAIQDVPELGIGSGLSSAEAGLRLRYEIVPEFAPYVGVQYERAFGDAARFQRADGEEAGGWSLLLGVRTWF